MPENSDDVRDDDVAKPAPKRAAPAAASSQRSPIPVVALVLALVALLLSGWALLRPSSSSDSGSSLSTEEAKDQLCSAFDTVRKGVALNANASAPGGPEDIAGGLAVMANARLSLSAGGLYLLSRIDSAAPENLAEEATKLANLLMDIGSTATSGVPTSDPAQAERMKQAEELTTTLVAQCGAAG